MITGKKAPKEKLTKAQAKKVVMTTEHPPCAHLSPKKKSISHITVTTTSTSKPMAHVTRASLMVQAKELGIKYFRILTKDELHEVTRSTILPETREAIIQNAKDRWKSGWGKRKATEAKG